MQKKDFSGSLTVLFNKSSVEGKTMKLKKFKDWNIFWKIQSISIIFTVAIVLSFQFYFLPKVRENIYDQQKTALRNVLDAAHTGLTDIKDRADKGEITQEQALQLGKNLIHAIKFDKKNYLYANNLDGYCVVSNNPENIGKYTLNDVDGYGVYTDREMNKIAAENRGTGYATFHWLKEGKIVAKLYCFTVFQPWQWRIVDGVLIADIDEKVSDIANHFWLVLGLVSVLLFMISYVIVKKITGPVVKLSAFTQAVTEGDYSTSMEVHGKDEIGRLASNFNQMVSGIRDSMEEIKVKSKEAEIAAAQAEEAKNSAEKQNEALIESSKQMLEAISRFSQGDLRVNLETKVSGEIGLIFEKFSHAVGSIRNMVMGLNQTIEQTARVSAEISSSAEQMAAGAQEQSMQANDVASASEEMTKTIMENSRNAQNVAETAKDNIAAAEEGGAVVKGAITGMEKISTVVLEAAGTVKHLGESSEKIGEIVQVINDIADQTNLLALNAAIEAARAGEQGRGFAVVADEVRKLAERTTKATKEIEGMIKQIQGDTTEAVKSIGLGTEEVERGKVMTAKAGSSLQNIIGGTERASDLISSLAAASQQQAETGDQIAKNVDAITGIIEQNSIGIQQIAKASEDLRQLTESLEQLSAGFKI